MVHPAKVNRFIHLVVDSPFETSSLVAKIQSQSAFHHQRFWLLWLTRAWATKRNLSLESLPLRYIYCFSFTFSIFNFHRQRSKILVFICTTFQISIGGWHPNTIILNQVYLSIIVEPDKIISSSYVPLSYSAWLLGWSILISIGDLSFLESQNRPCAGRRSTSRRRAPTAGLHLQLHALQARISPIVLLSRTARLAIQVGCAIFWLLRKHVLVVTWRIYMMEAIYVWSKILRLASNAELDLASRTQAASSQFVQLCRLVQGLKDREHGILRFDPIIWFLKTAQEGKVR